MKAKTEIESSSFYQNFLSILKEFLKESQKSIEEILCLGLGHFSTCKTALYQLAFLLLLGEEFQNSAEVFDPVFTCGEKQILSHLKLKLAVGNCEGKKKSNLSGFTLFFFPHCPKELSNNLIYTNWNPANLENCILYANSFEAIRLNTPHRFLRSYHYLLQSPAVVEELPIPNTFRIPDIFNDLSLHCFPSRLTSGLPQSFWETPEPIYSEETELIGEG